MDELYTGKIDEFVDWRSGKNSFNGQDITEGKKVSGWSIRELLQEKLKTPIYVKEDTTNNLYRIFSSEKAYTLWAENPSDNAELQLFTIPRPSDYKLDLMITNNGDRYVKAGDDTNVLNKIQFSWKIYNDEGDSSDGLTVTYTILNVESGSSNTFIRRYNKGVSEDFNIYKYLKTGENRITIEGQGNTTGARNSSSFNITLLDIKVECGFNFAGEHAQNETLRVPYTFYRNNTDGTAKVFFVVDDGQNGKTYSVDILSGGQTRIEDTGMMISPHLTEGQHSLQVYAEASYNDGQVTVFSNLLYFTFTVATNEAGAVDKFINVATSFNNGTYPFSQLMLATTQYYPTQLRWGYYTYASNTDTQIPVVWKLLVGQDDENPITLSTITANTSYEASTLNFIPSIYTENESLFLVGCFKKSQEEEDELVRIPIYITQNSELANIYETANYELKMSAYGKTNDSSDKAVWSDETGTVTTDFTNIVWNPNSGWYNNSFRTSGIGKYAEINFQPLQRKNQNDQLFPFEFGKTIEIEFESEKVINNDDVLIRIGSAEGARIEITPNKASLYSNAIYDATIGNYVQNEIVHTNYKANERIKLAFIINKYVPGQNSGSDDGLAYIVNNGILERGGMAGGFSFNAAGNIKIGGSQSGVRVYNIRVYDKAITYQDAYNNFVYDSDDKVNIVSRNNILSQGNISYELCKNKIDTILITGNLSALLTRGQEKTDADVMIERTCPYDQSKDFIIGELVDDPDRPGEKKIINGARIRKHGQSTLNYPITSLKFWTNKSKSGEVPIFSKTGQEGLLLNKNRYKMKNTSIPANKFVLQANYADSSGVHNGGLLRLIQSSWYNARVNGKYVLRTEPQLFATIKTTEKQNYGIQSVWDDYQKKDFPYNIETAPDSFPCAVFYYDLDGTKTSTFLGQYVFMEDKKSDYNYGERSIYNVATDPFCLTVTHSKDDTVKNRIWDNSNVLRIECLSINGNYSSFVTDAGFEARNGNKYGWESEFEMIYPDPDDIEGRPIGPYIDSKGVEKYQETDTTKFGAESEFRKKAQPFVEWFKWVISTKGNHQKFRAEAAGHLDLYKLAAYYVFVLRFGLVDSLERNAQLKTYDGVHWHYEPWDMDIALGNKNDGGIAFNPPIDRNTKLNVETYAISGKVNDSNNQLVRSNWLWDALEAWDEWQVMVKDVADALYNAGLTYDNVTEMFDDEYANKWCEIMYNKSGHYKYVESANGDPAWLSWLQGARMSHRHWWLSTSMDYYDAKWFCGDYKNHSIYLAANVAADPNKRIVITPNGNTYMTITKNNDPDVAGNDSEVVQDTVPVSPTGDPGPFIHTMESGASTKEPIHVYGANFMEEIDLSDIAGGIDAIDVAKTYSKVLGAPLRVLNVGTNLTEVSTETYTTNLSQSTCRIAAVGDNGENAFENLETLNIRGHQHLGNVEQFTFGINQFIRDLNMSQLKNFYAMGSTLTNFYSSDSGNSFEDVELPSTVYQINMKNSTWNNLTFWDTTPGQGVSATITKHATILSSGTSNVPSSLMELHLLGSTGRTKESLILVRNWLKSIVADRGESALSEYTLEMDDVNWSPSVINNDEDLLTYDELRLISLTDHHIRGYVMLQRQSGEDLTASQLTEIRTWFGDSVFTKGSSGLVVDYKHNYIQINIGGDVTIIDGEVYLEEGKRAMLSATQFLLSDTPNENYVWGMSSTENGQPEQVARLLILNSQDTADNKTYLVARESDMNADYDVWLKVTAGGTIYSACLHIIGVKYPQNIKIDATRVGINNLRTAPNIITLWENSMGCNVFVSTEDSYTAKVREIVYTITDPSGHVHTYSTTTGPSWTGECGSLDRNLEVYQNSNPIGMDNTSCIRVMCSGGTVPSNNDIYEYIVDARIAYTSNVETELHSKILVMQDEDAITDSLHELLYTPISNLWNTQFGEPLTKVYLYRTDLLTLTGTLDFTGADSLVSGQTFNNLIVNNGRHSLLEYIPNVTGLILDGCANLTTSYLPLQGSEIPNVVFDNMPHLQTLSIQNCSSLTGTIDLSNCPITSVNATGTSVNITLPTGTAITNLALGTPTSIVIDNPTVMEYDDISVADSSSLTNVELTNVNSTAVQGYRMFGQIFGIS